MSLNLKYFNLVNNKEQALYLCALFRVALHHILACVVSLALLFSVVLFAQISDSNLETGRYYLKSGVSQMI